LQYCSFIIFTRTKKKIIINAVLIYGKVNFIVSRYEKSLQRSQTMGGGEFLFLFFDLILECNFIIPLRRAEFSEIIENAKKKSFQQRVINGPKVYTDDRLT